MAGGLNAHTNPFVEAWGLKREHIEKTFRWTPKTLGVIALTGVVFPVVVYNIMTAEFVRARAALCAAPRSAFATPFAATPPHAAAPLARRSGRTAAQASRRSSSCERATHASDAAARCVDAA